MYAIARVALHCWKYPHHVRRLERRYFSDILRPLRDLYLSFFFFFQAEDGIRDKLVTGVQTCALPISRAPPTPEVARRAAPAPAGTRPTPSTRAAARSHPSSLPSAVACRAGPRSHPAAAPLAASPGSPPSPRPRDAGPLPPSRSLGAVRAPPDANDVCAALRMAGASSTSSGTRPSASGGNGGRARRTGSIPRRLAPGTRCPKCRRGTLRG